MNNSHFINEIAPIQFMLTNYQALTDQNLRQVTHVRNAEIVAFFLCRDFVSPGGPSGSY